MGADGKEGEEGPTTEATEEAFYADLYYDSNDSENEVCTL
jgi:hypothetical protein